MIAKRQDNIKPDQDHRENEHNDGGSEIPNLHFGFMRRRMIQLGGRGL